MGAPISLVDQFVDVFTVEWAVRWGLVEGNGSWGMTLGTVLVPYPSSLDFLLLSTFWVL